MGQALSEASGAMRSFSDLNEYYTAVGSGRFWLTTAITLGFIAILVSLKFWLEEQTGWPDAYGVHCNGRGCFLTHLYHSSLLLRVGNAYEIGLFAFLWMLPAILLGCGAFAVYRRLRGNRL